MKIEITASWPKAVAIGVLHKGDLYKLPAGEHVYLVLGKSSYCGYGGPAHVRSVNLNSCNMSDVEPDRPVVRLRGKLTVCEMC